MNSVVQRIKSFLTSDEGPTAVEYAVMLALIIVVCLSGIMIVGNNTKSSMSNSANSIDAAVKSGS